MARPRYLLPLAAAAAALLVACAPGPPRESEARAAMTARLEASSKGAVKVDEIHALKLRNCAPAEGAEGMVCELAMDVSLVLDGETIRSQDTGPMRFVREGGEWTAYPVD